MTPTVPTCPHCSLRSTRARNAPHTLTCVVVGTGGHVGTTLRAATDAPRMIRCCVDCLPRGRLMGRRHVEVATPPLALRRAEAAAALALSVETFDAHVRPELPVICVASVVTYPVTALQAWLARHEERPAATRSGGPHDRLHVHRAATDEPAAPAPARDARRCRPRRGHARPRPAPRRTVRAAGVRRDE